MRGPKDRRGHLGSSLEACMILGPVDRGERERECIWEANWSGWWGWGRSQDGPAGDSCGLPDVFNLWRILRKLEAPTLKDAQTAWGGQVERLGVTGGINAGAPHCTSRDKCAGSLLARRVTCVQPPATYHEAVNTGHSQGC